MFIIIGQCSKSVYIEFALESENKFSNLLPLWRRFEPEVSISGQLIFQIMCVSEASNSTFDGLLFFFLNRKS